MTVRQSRFGTLEDRFWAKVEKTDSCWNWTGAQGAGGYGTIRRPQGGNTLAHRVAYELFSGPIPEGLDIDHLCRNRGCVNPAHLEAVTHRENMRRAASLRTHCPQGHPYSGDNLYVNPRGARDCRTCRRAAKARYEAKGRGTL